MDELKQRYKELGDFLKTRRAKILPSQVGLPEGLRRRTPGLRREEVSFLSGVGLTWYTWLEQGRPIQISAQVLESLARTFMLDKEEAIHLYTLAKQAPPASLSIVNNTVTPMLQHVLDNLEFSPATILDSYWNIIAWNKAAAKIIFDYGKIDACKRNLIRIMFTNEEYKETIPNWNSVAQDMIARFRATYGKFTGDLWGENFVNELRSESTEFDSWWIMHNVKTDDEMFKNINHPILGSLKFEYTAYQVLSENNLRMTILSSLPGSDMEKKIKQFLMS